MAVIIPATGSGDSTPTIATNQVGGAEYQQVKLVDGTAGSAAVIPGDATHGLFVNVKATVGLTDTELRASAVPISGTVTTGGLTDTQLRASAVPVSAAALPLPSGAATAANQTTEIAGLASIDSTLSTLNGKVTAVNTGAVTISAALPAGNNNIGDVDVASVTGNVTVVQPTGTNLHIVADSGTITTVSAVTAITNALPAGTNAIGKLAANSGVDIGDVDVTSVIPGTGASNLGKAEDGAHTTGDVGVMALGVSNENQTAFSAASADYTPVAVNRYGQVYVTAPPPSHASSNGTPITATTTTVIAAPSSGNHLRIVRFLMSNGGATATWVAIRDGAAGTRHYNAYLMQGSMYGLNLASSGPLDLTTATRLDIFLSAAGSVEYEIDYVTVAD